MYCRYCGKKIPDDSRFCIYCGKRLELDSSQKTSSGSSQNSTTYEKKADPSLNEAEDRLSHLKNYNDIYSAFVKVDERINKGEWEDAIMQIRNALEAMTLHLLKEYKTQNDINAYLKSLGLQGGAGTYIGILKDALIIDQESASHLYYLNSESSRAHHISGQPHEYTESEAKNLYGALLKESKKFTSVYLHDITEKNKQNLDNLFWQQPSQDDTPQYDTPKYKPTYNVIDHIRDFFFFFMIAFFIVLFISFLTVFV